ncbi:Uma2 family endonuclease [Limnothrix sp. FACHB-1083]|uniref:Uma2 family endonuclease n=1 Tax=unclassified Limnothrix TaxID=2632864 RepID=UPI0016812C06|nr:MULTISPECIES: Uma2 family endonuclease [unclassified Limnothrix]MBD2162688.1 Uma2 family endonuclease [Limnothrix sp. FACHB-1083]MBD2193760.1 Uma2 family endonuclease [Limnothrix sp. FACHB-1088]
MIAIPNSFTAADYLAFEESSNQRHEYRGGLVYAMAGGSGNHSALCINLLSAIHGHLRQTDCRFYGSDVKVSYADRFFYYPDAFVTCDPRDRTDRYVKRYPKLIAEVLSPSTELFDHTTKFEDYQLVETLEEYVLIDQEKAAVECRRRVAGDRWESQTYQAGDRMELISIGLTIAIEDLYAGLDEMP